jgi:DNA-binding CsgD family transcriptional regulator/tetratricopeptide (TPR) repeat protein
MAVRVKELPGALWLDAEDAAVHQGLAWALDHDPPTALRLASALAPWWLVRGRWVEGYALTRRAVEQTGPEAETWYTAQVLLGWLSQGASNLGVLLGHHTAVVDALRDGPPCIDLIDALTGRSSALRNMGRLTEATADARTALRLARRLGYAAGEADALRALCFISLHDEKGEDAVAWARQAQLVDPDRLPERRARFARFALLVALVESGHFDGASDLFEELLPQARAAGDLSVQADMVFFMGVLALGTGQLAEAGVRLREAAELAARGCYPLRLIDILGEAGRLCAATGQHAEAVALWSARAVQRNAAGISVASHGEDTRRELLLQDARRTLGPRRFKAAQDRGAAMTLAAAVEFAVLTTGERAPQTPAPPPAGNLSTRERELVALVAQGQTDAQIAEKLFISVSTVRTHLDRIRDKTGCRRRADLTRLALKQAII